jgi:hypothetical protein
MSTLSQVRSKVADKILRNDFNSQIDTAINRIINECAGSYRFWFNETIGTFLTIANQETYATEDGIPSDILEIDYVKQTLSLTDQPSLYRRTFSEIQTLNTGRSTGDPTYYAWYQNKFYFHLIPNSAKTITVFYAKSYTELSADADTNDFTNYAEDLIEAGACEIIFRDFLRETENALIQEKAKLKALQRLWERTDRITSTRQIIPTSF